MTRRILPLLAILAFGTGCTAAQPTAAVAIEATANAATSSTSTEEVLGSEEGSAFHVGDLSWTTSTSSTYQGPEPVY